MTKFISEGTFDSEIFYQKSTEFKNELKSIERNHQSFFRLKPISNFVITNIDFIHSKIKLQEFAETLHTEIKEEIQTAFEKVWIVE